MSAIYSLVFANIALWLGFALYFFLLTAKQRKLEKQIQILSEQFEQVEQIEQAEK